MTRWREKEIKEYRLMRENEVGKRPYLLHCENLPDVYLVCEKKKKRLIKKYDLWKTSHLFYYEILVNDKIR